MQLKVKKGFTEDTYFPEFPNQVKKNLCDYSIKRTVKFIAL